MFLNGGGVISGIEIISPDKLKEIYDKNKYRIIITSRIYRDIEIQLEKMGIFDYNLYSEGNEKRYYPVRELIINPYENSSNMTEEKWNAEMLESPMKHLIRKRVDELYKDMPLFNHVEIETINRCNGICSFCPVNTNIDVREENFFIFE